LKPGDVVISLDGHPVTNVADLRTRASSFAPESDVALEYMREGRPGSIRVRIASLPVLRLLGIRLRDEKDERGDPSVVIDQVQVNSPAFRERLVAGLRLVAVGETEVHSKAEADAAADKLDPLTGVSLKILLPNGKAAVVPVGGQR
jgi:serine protease Do